MRKQVEAREGLSGSILMEENIKQLMESKADKTDLAEINNLKSNKNDMENSLRWIDILHS